MLIFDQNIVFKSEESVCAPHTLTRETKLGCSMSSSAKCKIIFKTYHLLDVLKLSILCTLWCLYMWILRTGYGNIKGSARFANPSSGRGELIVSFNPCNVCLNIDFTDFIDFNFLPLSIVGRKKRSLFGDGTQQANYKVVKTDYTSYSVVYNCNPIGNILKKGKDKNNSSKERLFLKWSEYDFWF